MGEAAASEELDTDETIQVFQAGLANVQTMTKAQVGDKTLMDALIPAIDAMNQLNGTNASLSDIFNAAATAAQRGADSTTDLIAKHGRARNLGERSRGHLDAGAASTALIYAAYANEVKNS
jgi:dihydroxyacetone kinase-like protein